MRKQEPYYCPHCKAWFPDKLSHLMGKLITKEEWEMLQAKMMTSSQEEHQP